MQMNDGHQLRCSASAARIQVVPCTRWIELQGSLDYHIQLAGLLEATTMFRMLNDPGRGAGPQSFTAGQPGAELSIKEQVLTAQEIVRKSSPRGVTPLTQHLKEIRVQLVAVEGSLRAKGQEAVVVLATDGLPSNAYGESSESVLRDFLIALKALQSLPVWIVIRLCTDDKQVVNYYNSLDNEVWSASAGGVCIFVNRYKAARLTQLFFLGVFPSFSPHTTTARASPRSHRRFFWRRGGNYECQ
jgi:hypothetical protein